MLLLPLGPVVGSSFPPGMGDSDRDRREGEIAKPLPCSYTRVRSMLRDTETGDPNGDSGEKILIWSSGDGEGLPLNDELSSPEAARWLTVP